MLEAITLNLIASGLASCGGIGRDKVQTILQRKRFSGEVDELATEFTTALKTTIEPALTEHASADINTEIHWPTIAEELDECTVVFEDEQEAIVHLTNAICKGLDIDPDDNPALRDAVETAVAEAYQTMIQTFADRIAGTDLAAVFNTQTNIGLTNTVTTLDERLTTLQQQLCRHDTATLRNAGFIHLDSLFLDRKEPGAPDTAWRIGFDFAEVQAGYPLLRERPAATTDERQSVTDNVFARLATGENLVVIGEGGSGKSTVCKQVACQWCNDADRGSVLYHGRTTTASFDEPGTLIETVRAAKDELLVVIEDAPTGDATAIYEVLDEFEQASDVAFLLDARASEWRDADDVVDEARLEYQRKQLGIVEMPALDEQECQRASDHYEALTGDEIGMSTEQLYDEIQGADTGGPLVLAYRLTGPAINSDQPVSALHGDVRQTYTAVDARADGDGLKQTVAVMVNVLNAAELPVEDAFLHALADNRADHRTIDQMVGFLEGTMLEQADGEVRTPHPLWSALYLERMCEVAGERLARDRFEQCVETLFRLVDDEEHREQVRHWVRSPPDVFAAITEAPDETASRFVRRIAAIGMTRHSLGTLYGTPETWRIPLPDPCSVAAEVQWFTTRGTIHHSRGSFDAAEAEFERLDVLIESMEDEIDESERRQAIVLRHLGTIARKRGDLTVANGFYEQSLAIAQKIDDRYGEARSIGSLGQIAHERGNLETAEEYHRETLAISQEIDNRPNIAGGLTNLGYVAQKRDDLEVAKEYYEESLAIERKRGDRRGIATNLSNLGNVAKDQGDLETAEEYHRETLAIAQEMGDRHSKAKSLVNLGIVAFNREDFRDAEEHFKQGRDIFQDVGTRPDEARSIGNLGNVALSRGDLAAAEEYYEESITINQEIGAHPGTAWNLINLGIVAKERGNLKVAEKHIKQGCDIFRDVGIKNDVARSLTFLGAIAKERGNLEAAEEYYEETLTIYREESNRHSEAHTLGDLGRIAQERDDLKIAKEYFEEAIGIFRDIDTISCAFPVFNSIIDVCEQRGAAKDATKWCEQAIELADQVEDTETLETFQKRRSEGDDT